MARYQVPPDPRQGDSARRPRWQRQDSRQPIPWLWLGLGFLVTLIGIGLAYLLAASFLTRAPIADALPTPTIVRLTAPPTQPPTPTVPRLTATPIVTFTPVPTRDLSNPPDVLTIGYYAQVTGTGDVGVSVRGGPSTDNVRLLTASEGTLVLVLDGPVEGDGFFWWQVELNDGTTGWVAGDFIVPAPAPAGR